MTLEEQLAMQREMGLPEIPETCEQCAQRAKRFRSGPPTTGRQVIGMCRLDAERRELWWDSAPPEWCGIRRHVAARGEA